MKKSKTINSGSATYNFHAERFTMVVPKIVKEYKDKDGVRMYKTDNGKKYVADIYDKNFVIKKQKIMPRNYKGDL